MTDSDDRPVGENPGSAEQPTSQFGNTSLLSGIGTTESEEPRRQITWHVGADFGLLVLRIVVGLTVGAHGLQKIFGLFGGPGINGFSMYLGQMGFGHTTVLAYVTGWSELVGGALLVLGLLTPLGAAAVLGVLGNALYMKAGTGFFTSATGGFEYELVLAASALALLFTGPGRVAMDLGRAWHRKPTAWGILGVLLAVVATVLIFVFGRK
ncbi:DoxX family protein [Sciscionella marina]|uniref:DoxX family protein n=1 Tax=Sciscionella marina TaxID=508770 RepID=UPI0003691B3E|nr:DoxX family protein [Sciscionella marina]